MKKNGSNSIKHWPIYLAALVLLSAVVWRIWFYEPKPALPPITLPVSENTTADTKPPEPAPQHKDNSADDQQPAPTEEKDSEPTLQAIVNARRTWNPILLSTYGKPVQDFTFLSLDGKLHKLSDYAGKNVLLNFWATYCPPCKIEIPHLVELRRQIPNDQLAILGISTEPPKLLKDFVAKNNMNFTIGTLPSLLPEPFVRTRAIPTSFFLDKEQRVKLVAEGALFLHEMKAILRAER